jgi:hypothetical protein
MPIDECHVLMLNSCIAATLCMTVISVILAQKERSSIILPFMFAVLLFSVAWLSVLLYISLPFNTDIILCTKGLLLAGVLLFVIGVFYFFRFIILIIRMEEIRGSENH